MKYKNFYEGFEGEPEYVFELEDDATYSLHMWEGYIDMLVDRILIQPVDESSFLHQLYNNDDVDIWARPWEIPSVEEASKTLSSILDRIKERDWHDAIASLIDLLDTARERGKRVYMRED